MARLAETVIEQIKQEISLVRLAESQGHQLKKHGKDYALNCPFHEDRTASLIITPTSNLWHCMGACNQGGSVIDWVMKSQGVSFRFACELLQQDLGLVLDAGTKATKQNTTTKLPPPLAANADNQTALKQVIDYYHETLKQSPEAQEYLRSRGLAHPELIERFKLGGRQINFHAADRMVNPPRGRSGMSAAEVDEVHDGATNVRKTFFHPDHSSKTYRHQALVLM